MCVVGEGNVRFLQCQALGLNWVEVSVVPKDFTHISHHLHEYLSHSRYPVIILIEVLLHVCLMCYGGTTQ